MVLILTMAGAGKRFIDAGFSKPKFMLRANGESLLYWSLLSVREFCNQEVLLVCQEDHDTNWIADQVAQIGLKNYRIITRKGVSKGQAQTAYEATDELSVDDELWVYNIDTFVKGGMERPVTQQFAGCVHVFESNKKNMSFVKYGPEGDVEEIVEKKVISNWASVGLYGFSKVQLYRDLYEKVYGLTSKSPTEGEQYIAPMYQYLIRDGEKVIAPKIKRENVHILGTPEELSLFDPNAFE